MKNICLFGLAFLAQLISAQGFFIKPETEYKLYTNFGGAEVYTNPDFVIKPYKVHFKGLQPITIGLLAGYQFNNKLKVNIGYCQETSRIGTEVGFNTYDSLSKLYLVGGTAGNVYYSLANKLPLFIQLPTKLRAVGKGKFSVQSYLNVGVSLYIQRKQDEQHLEFSDYSLSPDETIHVRFSQGAYQCKRLMFQLGYSFVLIKTGQQNLEFACFYETSLKNVLYQQATVTINNKGNANTYVYTMEGKASGFGFRLGYNFSLSRKNKKNKTSDASHK